MTHPLSNAPILETLSALRHEYRRVATQTGPGRFEWFGDLTDGEQMDIYAAMLWEKRTLTQITWFPGGSSAPLLFARIVPGVDAETAYAAAAAWTGAIVHRRNVARAIREKSVRRRLA